MLEGEVNGKLAELAQAKRSQQDLKIQLENIREQTPDHSLVKQCTAATAVVEETRQQTVAAEQALQDMGPQLLEGEHERATQALTENQEA